MFDKSMFLVYNIFVTIKKHFRRIIMGNLKHAMSAIIAVSLVGSLAAIQAVDFSAVKANKLTQETEAAVTSALAVLTGDGEGETVDFNISAPELQVFAGKDAYILTSGGSINLRAAADTESTILNVLSVGTQVKIIDVDEDWFKVEAGEFTGYVKSDFITLDYNKVQSVLLSTVMYQKGTVIQSINVRAEAKEDSVILSQVGEGSAVTVLEQDGDWLKVYFGENYDIGYISAQYVTIGDMVSRKEVNKARSEQISKVAKAAKIKTSDSAVAVKLIPNENSETLTTLANNANCKIISGGTNWTKIIVSATNEIGYVKTENVSETVTQPVKSSVPSVNKTVSESGKKSSKTATEAKASSNGSALVAQAAKYIGTRYVYGGTSPAGFDCSGLVQYCCKKLGVSVSRSASAQYSNGKSVSRANLQPGDLVFFSKGSGISHVGIYAGNGQIIHAPRQGKSVCYQSMNSLGSLKYVGARRVL